MTNDSSAQRGRPYQIQSMPHGFMRQTTITHERAGHSQRVRQAGVTGFPQSTYTDQFATSSRLNTSG
jgi:hypothetical protein